MKPLFFTRAIFPFLCFISLSVCAADTLVEDVHIRITTSDIAADALRMPVDTRKAALSRPENVSQLASTLFVRRAIAAQAERDGLAADPVVAASLQLARDRVLSDAVLLKFNETHTPSDKTLEAYALATYKAETKRFQSAERWGAKHILIKSTTPESRVKAEQLLAQLNAGANFEQLARDNSDDAGSAAKGGDVGYFTAGAMVAPFEAAVVALKQPGDLSGIVESQFGFHLIKFVGYRAAGVQSFDEVRDLLKREATATLVNEARKKKQQEVLNEARFDQAAIDAFAASQKP